MLKKVTDFKLPKEFKIKSNPRFLAQALRVYEERSHVGLRKTKTRAEVLRTGKKLYKQKGTGGARHGSRRAPIFVGGGVAFGPRPIRRILTLSSKQKILSKMLAISAKAEEKEIVTVMGLGKIEKTKEAADFIKKLEGKRFTFVFADKNASRIKRVKNLKNVEAIIFKDVNARNIMLGGTIVLDKEIFAVK
jgi:large subunit ribosomal protein L4